MKNIYKVNEEAVKKIAERVYDNGSTVINRNDLEEMFPELKKESDDERIINNIKKVIGWYRGMFTEKSLMPEQYQEINAWLEKQGENISLPKFTFDDVLALQCCMETVKKVQEDKELYEQLQSLHDRLHDAYWLEKKGEKNLTPIFRIGDTIIAKDGTYIEKEPFHIDSIEDDCYWDGENTILVCNQDEFEIFKQKTAEWSEEDNLMLQRIIQDLVSLSYECQIDFNDKLNWLKSLKGRYAWKPSEEQMVALNNAILLNEDHYNGAVLSTLYEHLKKLL